MNKLKKVSNSPRTEKEYREFENRTRAPLRTRSVNRAVRFLNRPRASLGCGPCVTVCSSCTSRSPKKIRAPSRSRALPHSIVVPFTYYQRLWLAHPSVGTRTPIGLAASTIYSYFPNAL